jgi:hypothetical protein
MITESKARPNNHQIGRAGLYRAAAELELLGIDVRVDREPVGIDGAAADVLTLRRNGDVVGKLRVRTTLLSSARGYQARIDDDFTAVDGWVFVDLQPTGEATFYIVPSAWLATDIDHRHQQFLADHGNERPQTKDSKHHLIEVERLEQWRNAWSFIAGLE